MCAYVTCVLDAGQGLPVRNTVEGSDEVGQKCDDPPSDGAWSFLKRGMQHQPQTREEAHVRFFFFFKLGNP